MSLYDELAEALENDPPESAQEALLNAAFLFEKGVLSATTRDLDDLARSMGWPPEVLDQEPSEVGAQQLRDALTRFIRKWMDHPSAGLAVWALSKLRDPGLKALLDEVLDHHLEGDPNILFQTLVALQNLGIRIPGGEQGLAIHEVERNRSLARSYRGTTARSPRASSLMILVAGPYRSGTNDDPVKMEANVTAMTDIALRLYRAGHLPMVGEWFALPLVEAAGSQQVGDAVFNEIFPPIARRILERCDACLRIGGASQGADEMVRLAQAQGKQVFYRLEEIPGCA
jgi:hypothetical protein